MRIVTYRSERGDRAGVLRDGRVVDPWDALWHGAAAPPTVRALLEADLLAALADRLAGGDPPQGSPLGDVTLLPPITDPDKIVCIGLNYRSHAAEAGLEPPDAPTFFAKFRNALAGPAAAVAPPSEQR